MKGWMELTVPVSALSFADRIVVAFDNVAGGIADRVPALAAAIVVLLIAWLLGRAAFSITRRILARRSTTGSVDVLVARFARGCVVALGIVVALGVLGVDMAALAASLGLAGLTLGFALRDVLANSVSGVLLLLQRPFKIGDSISVADVEGVVDDVRVRDTVVRMTDGRRAYVPNTTVFNGVVINTSDRTLRRFEVALFAPLGCDLPAACAAVRAAVAGCAGVLADPAADAHVASAGPTRARIVARGWVETQTHSLDAVRGDALVAASTALHVACPPTGTD